MVYALGLSFFWIWCLCFRWVARTIIVAIRDSGDYMKVLLHSYHTTITGCGVHLIHTLGR